MQEYKKENITLPTIGRVVYFYDASGAREKMAFVTDVIEGHKVNLFVINHNGSIASRYEVRHAKDSGQDAGQNSGVSGAHWDWMPYQKGQATKTEELQRELDNNAALALGAAARAAGPSSY